MEVEDEQTGGVKLKRKPPPKRSKSSKIPLAHSARNRTTNIPKPTSTTPKKPVFGQGNNPFARKSLPVKSVKKKKSRIPVKKQSSLPVTKISKKKVIKKKNQENIYKAKIWSTCIKSY